MKLKLSYNEFNALYEILESAIEDYNSGTINFEKKLRYVILVETYKKFYQQALISKQEYRITLKPHEALNWWLFFAQYNRLPATSYEGNLLNKINFEIHQKYIQL